MKLGKIYTAATFVGHRLAGTVVHFKFRTALDGPVEEVPVPVDTSPKSISWLSEVLNNNPEIQKLFPVDD